MPIIENKKVPKHILLWGEENKVADLKQHGIWHYRQLTSDEFHVIAKAGHLCAYERPNEVNALIEKYLNASTSEK
jgi:pimeloyl-ACP methyl ester carboxylesterase